MSPEAKALADAASELQKMATARFATYGGGDIRGAAIWDVADWLYERAHRLRDEDDRKRGAAT